MREKRPQFPAYESYTRISVEKPIISAMTDARCLSLNPVVKVDRRIRWHYTTTILRLRIGARLTRYRNCKFHNGCRTISRHADGISRYSVPPSAGPLLPLIESIWCSCYEFCYYCVCLRARSREWMFLLAETILLVTWNNQSTALVP